MLDELALAPIKTLSDGGAAISFEPPVAKEAGPVGLDVLVLALVTALLDWEVAISLAVGLISHSMVGRLLFLSLADFFFGLSLSAVFAPQST